MAEIVQIPIGKLLSGDHANRASLDDEAISDLASSIGRLGVLNPLLVVSTGDSFTIIAGHRRLIAAQRAGLSQLPCIVREDDVAGTHEISLVDNVLREALTPLEVACAIKDAVDNKITTVEDIAGSMHRTVRWVAAQIAMLSWPADVLEVIQNGTLSVSAASNLALIEEENYRNFLLRTATEQGATARTTAAWLQAYRASKPPEIAVTAEPVPAGSSSTPAVPQAPCLACGEVYRTDELSHVPICTRCIKAIRSAG